MPQTPSFWTLGWCLLGSSAPIKTPTFIFGSLFGRPGLYRCWKTIRCCSGLSNRESRQAGRHQPPPFPTGFLPSKSCSCCFQGEPSSEVRTVSLTWVFLWISRSLGLVICRADTTAFRVTRVHRNGGSLSVLESEPVWASSAFGFDLSSIKLFLST